MGLLKDSRPLNGIRSAWEHILLNFEKDYPIDGIFTKPEILDVRPIPFLKPPKTTTPIRAMTEDTPFEKIGRMLSPTEE